MSLVVVIHNDGTGTEAVGHYDYEVLVGDGTRLRSRVIAKGRVEGHQRARGWVALVERVLEHEHKGGQ